jgi:phage terminase large subunit-like protein
VSATAVESGLFCPSYAAATRAADFSWWCRTKLIQTVDQWSGRPLELEPWQERFFSDALATDEAGLPYWKIAGLVVSRKCGKTAMISAYCLYQLLEMAELAPEVLMAASSDKQAGRLFDATVSYIRKSQEMSEMVHRREYIGEVARVDGQGKIIRMASDPNRAHGYNASTVAVDELHAFTTPSLRRAWGAFVSGGGARDSTQVLFISTAGDAMERDDSILGQMLDANEAKGEIEREPGLTISRHHAARTLIYNYSAPTDDRMDVEALKLANPASWITVDYLKEQAESPAMSTAEVLQLHGCVWSSGQERFIDPGKWSACEERVEIPDKADIYVGIDMSLSEDCSAVSWAWPRGEGEVVVEAYVWAARPDVAADEYVAGGEIDPREVELFITDVLAKRYRVREIAYDPALFSRSAYELKDKGFTVAPVAQQSGMMAEAWKTLYSAVNNKTVRHDPKQRVLAAHVTNAVAEMTDRGWRVRKSKNSRKIDALVACTIAHWRAAVAGPKPSVYEKRGMLHFTFGEDDDEDD